MDISELAQRQRIERSQADARRAQRNQSPMQTGVVVSAGGDRVQVAINGGAAVTATNLGGVIRSGEVILVQSDGLNYWVRGAQSL
jgi:hypothetical protein